MDLEGFILSEISQRKIKLYDLFYMWNKKQKQINNNDKTKLIDTENGGCTRQGVKVEEMIELFHFLLFSLNKLNKK